MKRTLTFLTALFLWTSGYSDQPLAPEIELASASVSSTVATANGITIHSIDGPTDPVAVNTPVQITAHFAGASDNTHTDVIRWGDGSCGHEPAHGAPEMQLTPILLQAPRPRWKAAGNVTIGIGRCNGVNSISHREVDNSDLIRVRGHPLPLLAPPSPLSLN